MSCWPGYCPFSYSNYFWKSSSPRALHTLLLLGYDLVRYRHQMLFRSSLLPSETFWIHSGIQVRHQNNAGPRQGSDVQKSGSLGLWHLQHLRACWKSSSHGSPKVYWISTSGSGSGPLGLTSPLGDPDPENNPGFCLLLQLSVLPTLPTPPFYCASQVCRMVVLITP